MESSGDGTSTNRNAPVRVVRRNGSALANIVQVGAGANHSLALRSDGTLWAWGRNNFGQLGDGAFSTRRRAVQVAGLSGVKQMAGGRQNSIAVTTGGEVYTWGERLRPAGRRNRQHDRPEHTGEGRGSLERQRRRHGPRLRHGDRRAVAQAGSSHTDTCFVLSLVNGSRFQPLQRSRSASRRAPPSGRAPPATRSGTASRSARACRPRSRGDAR